MSSHIIFPGFTIGLASWLVALEFQWLRTDNPLYRNLFLFWSKVFAVSFGLGVVSGIVMSFELGTNWSRFGQVMERTGNQLGVGLDRDASAEGEHVLHAHPQVAALGERGEHHGQRRAADAGRRPRGGGGRQGA